MKELTVFEHDHVDVVDSRQVAEMVGKNHKDLMRSIREYVETLDRSIKRNFAPNDFFIESTYKDSIGRTLPCYLLTKKGCDMVANKHGLKNDQYGKWMHDKSPYSSKEVPSFRYKECVVDKLREILAEI